MGLTSRGRFEVTVGGRLKNLHEHTNRLFFFICRRFPTTRNYEYQTISVTCVTASELIFAFEKKRSFSPLRHDTSVKVESTEFCSPTKIISMIVLPKYVFVDFQSRSSVEVRPAELPNFNNCLVGNSWKVKRKSLVLRLKISNISFVWSNLDTAYFSGPWKNDVVSDFIFISKTRWALKNYVSEGTL